MNNVTNIRPGEPNAKTFVSSGGGGPYDGMEVRVAKLELNIEYISKSIDEIKEGIRYSSDKIGEIRIDTAKLDVKLDHKPSKRYIVTTIVTSSAVAVAILHLLNIFHVAH